MKKWVIFLFVITLTGFVFLSCSGDDSSTEPKNSAPVISSLTANPSTVAIGDNATINCVATDADGDALTYTWDIAGGAINGTGHSVIWTAPNTIGTYLISVTVSDGKDSQSKNLNVEVVVLNHTPIINSLTAESTSVHIYGTSVLSCDAYDTDGDSLSFIWLFTDGIITGVGEIITWTAPNSIGIYTITCTVSDGVATATEEITVSVTGLPEGFVVIPEGSFAMGDHFNEGEADGRELPVHNVTLSAFYLCKYLVTQKEWTDYMPSAIYDYGSGDNYPVYYVSWYAILKYCNLRSMAEGLTPCYTISSSTDPDDWGEVPLSNDSAWDAAVCNWSAKGYRLPTEAEWEYAARGALSGQRFPNGATISHSTNGATQANYNASTPYIYDVSPSTGYHPDYNGAVSPVSSFDVNGYGLYCMSGNLWELCWDWLSISYYSISPIISPKGPTSGYNRVFRGGNWINDASYSRVTYRYGSSPYRNISYGIGFRLARSP